MKTARNAFVVPARQRGNAGAMVHTRPARDNSVVVMRCVACKAYLDVEDDSLYCVDCEPEAYKEEN
jgi:hypothetical protein